MKAMDFLAKLRSSGVKPKFVMLDLAPGKPIHPWCTDGAVHAEIGSAESLTDIDFRPLVGLRVHLGDRSGNEARLRKVSKLAAEVDPALLIVYVEQGGSFTMHRRWADGTSDRSSI